MPLATHSLGRSGLQITRVGFGSWAVGGGGWAYGWGPQDDAESLATMRHALERASPRVPSGVMIAAHAEDRRAAAVSLSVGDVIHSVNGASVSNLEELRAALDGLKPYSPVVLQIERDGLLSFVAFELE